MTDDELDDEIRDRVQARLDERAQRLERMRQVRLEFDERRRHGKAKAHAAKLRRMQ